MICNYSNLGRISKKACAKKMKELAVNPEIHSTQENEDADLTDEDDTTDDEDRSNEN